MLLTVNIQSGRKLAGKKRDEILEAVLAVFPPETVKVVQVGYDVTRVTFHEEQQPNRAMTVEGIRLFGIFCRIQGGGPPHHLRPSL